MGVESHTARLILSARRRGVCLRRLATLGRQHFFLPPESYRQLMREFSIEPPPASMTEIENSFMGYADAFFRSLGAEEIVSIDASAFQGASLLHDLNEPLADEWKGRFDAVLDGGTLEHIFNFPMAIRNAMELLAPGGHLLGITPVNNYAGHGFYQFSPELVFRIFSEENGFELERLIACELPPSSPWFAVEDPKVLRRRVEFVNYVPTLLLYQARRISVIPIFSHPLQQSDYQFRWDGEEIVTGAPVVNDFAEPFFKLTSRV